MHKNKDWLYQKYIVEKLSSNKISEICGASDGAVRYWLRRHKIKIRTQSEANKLHPPNLSMLGRKHTEETKRKMSTSRRKRVITAEHRKNMSESRKKKWVGSGHPRWKGGRTVTTAGYVLIWKPEHPNANKKGRVPESRLIAERALGRYLKKGEVVHHINGNKSDNRNCNLLICHRVYHMHLHMKINERKLKQ